MPKELPRLPCACANVRRAARAISQVYDEELRATGLRPTQLTLLQALQIGGTLSQNELAEVLFIDSTTLSRSMRPLIDAGWVAAKPGSDKRERRYSLTAAGEKKIKLVTPPWQRAQRRLKRAFDGDWDAFERNLGQIASAFS
jgi:DNA-binding MarR family transcriptional regulator